MDGQPTLMRMCTDCGRKPAEEGKPICFRCRVATVGFTYRSAHLGRAGFHDTTVEREKRELFEHARRTGTEIERVR